MTYIDIETAEWAASTCRIPATKACGMNPVYKIASYISVSDDLLIESGRYGPRFRSIPDRGRWAAMWFDAQPFTYWSIFAKIAPPWEYWDRPAIPHTFTLWPRTERMVARIRTTRRDLRVRFRAARDGWLLREQDCC